MKTSFSFIRQNSIEFALFQRFLNGCQRDRKHLNENTLLLPSKWKSFSIGSEDEFSATICRLMDSETFQLVDIMDDKSWNLFYIDGMIYIWVDLPSTPGERYWWRLWKGNFLWPSGWSWLNNCGIMIEGWKKSPFHHYGIVKLCKWWGKYIKKKHWERWHITSELSSVLNVQAILFLWLATD